MGIATRARRLLINIGKALPFAICGIVLLSYLETLYAIVNDKLLVFNDYTTYYKPISQLIGCYFEYDWMSVIVLTIISFAVETCVWNKYAVLYLALHLIFKQWTITKEFLPMHIAGLCLINIVITTILCYKGLTKLKL